MDSPARAVVFGLGLVMVVFILRDAFEVIVLPRRLSGSLRIARGFYFVTWWPVRAIAVRTRSTSRRETLLSYYGPLWMISLVGLWALLMVFAFGCLHWGLGSGEVLVKGRPGFWNDLYISGTTFFTLGMGDVYPATPAARIVAVVEAGMGLAFLALVIGYLPVLYGSFSRREISISLFDARAGSPPTATELLRRYAQFETPDSLRTTLVEFERWTAEILESHLSYPVLAWYRSQHDRQSWLGAMTVILDASAALLAMGDGRFTAEARLAFAMARHTVIDLEATFRAGPAPHPERLSAEDFDAMCDVLAVNRYPITDKARFGTELRALRESYEASVQNIGHHLVQPVPGWLPEPGALDDWQTGMARTASPGA